MLDTDDKLFDIKELYAFSRVFDLACICGESFRFSKIHLMNLYDKLFTGYRKMIYAKV